MKKITKIASWKDLEGKIQEVLVEAQKTKHIAWHRFSDTRSAGNYLSDQPSDFLAGRAGTALFIEAKFSEVHDTLRSCFAGAVTDGQIASARIWERAGFKYIVLFYSLPAKQVEIWRGSNIIAARRGGTPLSLAARTIYQSVEEALASEVGYG
jgi:hypothetical protein